MYSSSLLSISSVFEKNITGLEFRYTKTFLFLNYNIIKILKE